MVVLGTKAHVFDGPLPPFHSRLVPGELCEFHSKRMVSKQAFAQFRLRPRTRVLLPDCYEWLSVDERIRIGTKRGLPATGVRADGQVAFDDRYHLAG